MRLEELKVYNQSMELGEEIWQIVSKQGIFEKDPVGKQLVRFADSIAANFSEGFERYHFKESNILVVALEDHYTKRKHVLQKQ